MSTEEERPAPKLPPAEYGQTDLLVVAGSQAYNLATPTSDFDYKGFYTAPLTQVIGVVKPHESWVSHDPADIAMHEVGHFLSMCLACNPNVVELLQIGGEHQLVSSPFADLLREHSSAFYSESAVRNAYGGYAMSQFKRLVNRQGTFSADTAKRTSKHARHLLRLLWQGQELLTEGTLTVRLDDEMREYLFHFGDLPYEEMAAEAETWMYWFDRLPNRALPPEPNRALINELLVEHRLETA